jgi:hypothetical protein
LRGRCCLRRWHFEERMRQREHQVFARGSTLRAGVGGDTKTMLRACYRGESTVLEVDRYVR